MFNGFFQGRRTSLIVLIVLLMVIWVVRILTPTAGTLTWDVFGYYLWLPAKFIQDDIWLDNIQWVNQLMTQYKPSETLYQAYIGPNGTWMYWFLFGMGIMYLPFFFIGHVWAQIGGYPTDGFSMPYQTAIAYGGVVYTSLGLYFLWKTLKKFFTEHVVSLVLVVIVLGTNYLYFTSIGGSATSNYLFTLLAALVWFTLSWHEKPTLLKAVLIGGLCGLIALIKPSEIFCVLIPILWPVQGGLKAKIRLIRNYWWHLAALLFAGLLVLFPQFFYWKQEAGSWIFDSYNNPGIGLDLLNPHIADVLFSFRKGWLIYTPLMVFGLVGFVFLFRKRKDLFWPLFIYFLISFYVIASWTEWWYGGGYGHRPLIVSYVVLAIAMGFFFQQMVNWKILKWVFGIIIIALLGLNLFQTWQYTHYILHSDRMTRAYYFKVFGKTGNDAENEKLLLTKRSFGWVDEFKNPEQYVCRNIGLYDFEDVMYPGFEAGYSTDTFHTANHSLRMDSTMEYSPEIRTTFNGITHKDHAWIKASVWFYFPDSISGEVPLLVISTQHKGGNYKYRTYEVKDKTPGTWQKVEAFYQTPEVRCKQDEVVVYIWNRSKMSCYIDDLRVDAYTLRD